ncbi:transporter [Komagataeibacter europaeus NBRC 3261]|uniref:Transporter n=1 Tax=Komagataeibacter europaeus NBRC 3261 TaxID=1234669 RepID=A0A0D6PZP6_KOMEU|nr:transporter [Komagataeibacter europaeus NBRC 3261]
MAGGLLAPMAQMTVARVAGRHMPGLASAVTLPVLRVPLLGPVVAGAILSVASWRWIFLLNLPFGLRCVFHVLLFLATLRLPLALPGQSLSS